MPARPRNLARAFACVAAALVVACAEPPHDEGVPLCPISTNDSIELRPGTTVDVTLTQPIDEAPIGTTWRGDALASSLLHRVFGRSVILKADDLRLPMQRPFRMLFDFMNHRNLASTAGLITEDLESPALSHDEATCLATFDPRLQEIWFHGVDHHVSSETSEFLGTGLLAQETHLDDGIAAMRDLLGRQVTTFGAPGNATDSDTTTALAEHPEIDAVFFEPKGRTTLPRALNLELPVHHVRPLEEFKESYFELEPTTSPLVLQGHPLSWDVEGWMRFANIIDFLAVDEGLLFTTAQAFVRWRADNDNIVVEKLAAQRYRIHLQLAHYAHLWEVGGVGVAGVERR